jgi:hypothetical protein
MANKVLASFCAANAAVNAAAFPARSSGGWSAFLLDLQMARITLVLAASRARPAKLSGGTPLAGFPMS